MFPVQCTVIEKNLGFPVDRMRNMGQQDILATKRTRRGCFTLRCIGAASLQGLAAIIIHTETRRMKVQQASSLLFSFFVFFGEVEYQCVAMKGLFVH